jgi:SOS response regulatory protein OraA/RecX
LNLLLRVSNYITRYAPSERKLREYIEKKKPTFHTTDFLIEIWYDEGMMCDMWIRTFLSSSRGEREIREKLQKKWFPRDMIEAKVRDSQSDIQSWETHAREIESRIDQLLRKWKSRKIIEMTLSWKYPYFRDEIRSLLEWKTDTHWLEREVERYVSKYDISDFSDRQKFFSALQRKWFQYREIQEILAKMPNESS